MKSISQVVAITIAMNHVVRTTYAFTTSPQIQSIGPGRTSSTGTTETLTSLESPYEYKSKGTAFEHGDVVKQGAIEVWGRIGNKGDPVPGFAHTGLCAVLTLSPYGFASRRLLACKHLCQVACSAAILAADDNELTWVNVYLSRVLSVRDVSLAVGGGGINVQCATRH